MRWVFALLMLASFGVGAACTGSSPTWSATNDRASVNTCVTNASEGDTINIASGTQTWTSGVTITKGLNIIGAGISSTVINASSNHIFWINHSTSKNLRISGIAFTGTGGDPSNVNANCMICGSGTLGGNGKLIRLDNLKFTNISEHAIATGFWDNMTASPVMLIDHITWTTNKATFSRFAKFLGHNSAWQNPDNYGTNDFIFIEDSTFTWTGAASSDNGVTDTEASVRLVVRYNTITGGGVQVHDTGSTEPDQGQRATEIYNNTFSCTQSGCSNIPAIGVRGGGWLIYNNAFLSTGVGWWLVAYPQVWRATVGAEWLGACDGTVRGTCNTFGTGTYPNSRFYHCSAGDHRACAFVGDSCGAGNGTCQIAASSSADCPAGVAFISNIDRVDGGSGTSGYPCRNQTGWGQEYSDGRLEYPSPVYWWNNTLDGNAVNFPNTEYDTWFQLNRDQCNHSPATDCGTKTGYSYTAYTYPHPGQGGLAAPTNLRSRPIFHELPEQYPQFWLARTE